MAEEAAPGAAEVADGDTVPANLALEDNPKRPRLEGPQSSQQYMSMIRDGKMTPEAMIAYMHEQQQVMTRQSETNM